MDRCTVCNLDSKPRKIGETLLKVKVPIRDVVDIVDFIIKKDTPDAKPPARASWDRHKNDGHFQVEEKVHITMGGEPVLELDEFVDKMWSDFQSANKGKVPDENRLMKWIELRAKVRNDMKNREEEKRMREAMSGAAPEGI